MAIRSPRTATSGPGRASGSDGRVRRGPGHRSRPVRTPVPVLAARKRADALLRPPPTGTADPPHEPPVSPTLRVLGRFALAPPPVREPREAHEEAAPTTPMDSPFPGVWERARAAVRERLPLWAQSRFGLAPRSLAALCVVLAIAAGFAVHHFWAGRPQPVRAPDLTDGPALEATASPGNTSGRGFGGASGGGSGRGARAGATPQPVANAAPSPAGALVVDVGGKVLRPGVYRLPTGSRVTDALTAAGGVREGADLTGVNRARLLTDGEQVLVGVPGAVVPPGPGAGARSASGTGSGTAGGSNGPVSLNTASVEQLDGLPGVGPVLAQHIADYRAQHGGFRSVDELREVNGIGVRKFNDLQPLVRL
ncbi:ComEA family DNA-binding protein [Streptomyces sp. NBC_01431]|uniref:ComEA family DNA-binding protein n=1 Tax=Streptomyces sp. NBC_01431 TaxID=2903863 RepID=UPI002E3759B0|nr:ComEA family DNA-binding protein [Streptomyces sp. NBC_01431]